MSEGLANEGDELGISSKESFEINKAVFQTASIIAFGGFVLLVTFLGSVWGEKQASLATLEAIQGTGIALMPVGFLVLLIAWKGGVDRRSRSWIENLNRTLPAWALATLFYLALQFIEWHSEMTEIAYQMN